MIGCHVSSLHALLPAYSNFSTKGFFMASEIKHVCPVVFLLSATFFVKTIIKNVALNQNWYLVIELSPAEKYFVSRQVDVYHIHVEL